MVGFAVDVKRYYNASDSFFYTGMYCTEEYYNYDHVSSCNFYNVCNRNCTENEIAVKCIYGNKIVMKNVMW